MKYLLSLGSNIGNKVMTIGRAIEYLGDAGVPVIAVSSLYRTAPVGAPFQDDFVNTALIVEGPEDPEKMLEIALQIENMLGRERRVKNGPRTIDIDIILAERGHYRSERLEIPHPRWRHRRFVVEPSREIVFRVECFARELASVPLSNLEGQQVTKIGEPLL